MSAATSSSVVVDPSQWRESNLDEYQEIGKSKALTQYKLREKDLEGLQYRTTRKMNYMGFNVTSYLYSELEVERKAWERYGGPEAFEAVLQKKYQEHLDKEKPRTGRKKFDRPDQYGNGKLKRKAPPRPPPRRDPYIKRSKALWTLHDDPRMSPWLWRALNETLDAVDTSAALRSASNANGKAKAVKPQFDTDKKRTAALAIAFPTLPMLRSSVYVSRPADPLFASPAVDALRSVLSDAPELPRAAGMETQGLDVYMRQRLVTDVHAGRTEYVYEWGRDYLDRLWYAVACVVRAQGAEAWASARWEVYDMWAEKMAGLQFAWTRDKGDGLWTDPGAKWLEDGFANSGFRREAIPRMQVALLL